MRLVWLLKADGTCSAASVRMSWMTSSVTEEGSVFVKAYTERRWWIASANGREVKVFGGEVD